LQGLGWSNQTTACDCEAGRGGVGCEVDVPSLSLGTPTTVVPTYNTDMKLIWKADVSASWGLYTIKVHVPGARSSMNMYHIWHATLQVRRQQCHL
jgi:hypothetical protein